MWILVMLIMWMVLAITDCWKYWFAWKWQYLLPAVQCLEFLLGERKSYSAEKSLFMPSCGIIAIFGYPLIWVQVRLKSKCCLEICLIRKTVLLYLSIKFWLYLGIDISLNSVDVLTVNYLNYFLIEIESKLSRVNIDLFHLPGVWFFDEISFQSGLWGCLPKRRKKGLFKMNTRGNPEAKE